MLNIKKTICLIASLLLGAQLASAHGLGNL